ncbi:MAG: MotA/TolQ/ExbB proton channel family protein [Leptonema sp. (in: bacteria)]
MFKPLNRNYTILSLILGFALFLGLNFHKEFLNAQPAQPTKEEQGVIKKEEQNQSTSDKLDKENDTNQSKESSQEKSNIEKSITKIWSLFLTGGAFMWPLLLTSIIGMTIILERIFYFWFHKFTSKTFEQNILDRLNNGIEQVVEYIRENKKYLISRILDEGLEISDYDPDSFIKGVEREALIYLAQAERGLSVLAAVSTIAPLIGFLGTVSGMINAFDAIANADTVNAKIVAAGIKEALITTAAGLIVAVPAMAMFQYFQNKVNTFSSEVETISNHIYKELLRIKTQFVKENQMDQKTTVN